MKKLLFIVFIPALIATSCKKERVCSCTSVLTSWTYNGNSVTFVGGSRVYESKIDKASKRTAAAKCVSGTRTETIRDSSTVDVKVYEVDCSLQ